MKSLKKAFGFDVSEIVIASPAQEHYEPAYDEHADEDNGNPYCMCGAIHDEEEEASGRCSACGKWVE